MSIIKDGPARPYNRITEVECDKVSKLIDEGRTTTEIRNVMGYSFTKLNQVEARIGKKAKRVWYHKDNLRRQYYSDARLRKLTPILTERELHLVFGLTINQAKALKARARESAGQPVLRSNTLDPRCSTTATPSGRSSTDTRQSSSGSSPSRTVDSSLIPRSRHTVV